MIDRRLFPRTLVLILTLLACCLAAEAASRETLVRFEVSVPASTPGTDGIFLVGNLPELGAWKGSGVTLRKLGNRTFGYEGRFAPGTVLEFKFTRGDFSRVEKAANGLEIPNRTFRVPGGLIATASFQVAAWADQIGAAPPQITGAFEILRQVPSKHLPRPRDVVVLLPPSYGLPASRSRRYPVLYLHDGGNLFDPGTSFGGVDWGVDETLDYLYRTGQMQEIIVVGIGNTADRMSEYTPFPDPKHGGGWGDRYGRFLVEELKPDIDRRFRTRKDREGTCLGGSSLGGLISVYLGLRYRQMFGGIIAMSPSFWWAEGGIIPWTLARPFEPAATRLWVDMGTAEGEEAIDFSRRFDAALRKAFPLFPGYRYTEIPGAAHNEASWRQRVSHPLLFLFGPAERRPRP
ncbi:MAG TPA: alpha/beta hydrolase-fold protein [Candidatus Ozemobacteraceae bacterium]|nr:alpha/beta hydrolase-fold protein [Candidatus Ozemobacteraceae bacterium]